MSTATKNPPKSPKPAIDQFAADPIVANMKRQQAAQAEEGVLQTIRISEIDVDVVTGDLDEDKVQEIADSIESAGLQQPIVVYWKIVEGNKPNRYCLGFGRHRMEAHKRLHLDTIRAFVRPAAPRHVIELAQAIENLARHTCSPLQESEYCRIVLAGDGGRSVEVAAAMIGWTVKTFQSRLDLLRLSPRLRVLLDEGRIYLQMAVYISRLADPAQQEEVAGMAAADERGGDPDMSVEDVRWEVSRRMLSLKSVPWRKDLEFAGKPACDACPCNSDNAPTLFAGERDSKQLCTNAPCYREKLKIANAQLTQASKSLSATHGPATAKLTLARVAKAIQEDGASDVVLDPAALLAATRARAAAAANRPTKPERSGKNKQAANTKASEAYKEIYRRWEIAVDKIVVDAIGSSADRASAVCLLVSGSPIDLMQWTGGVEERPMKIPPNYQAFWSAIKKWMAAMADPREVVKGGEALLELADAIFNNWRKVASGKNRGHHSGIGNYPLFDQPCTPFMLMLAEAWGLQLPPKPTPTIAAAAKPTAKTDKKKGGKR